MPSGIHAVPNGVLSAPDGTGCFIRSRPLADTVPLPLVSRFIEVDALRRTRGSAACPFLQDVAGGRLRRRPPALWVRGTLLPLT